MFTGDWHLFLEEVHKWGRDRVRAPAMPPAKSPKWKSRARPTGGKDTALQEKSDVFPLFHIKDPVGGDLEGGNDRQTHKGKGHKGIDARGNTHAVGGGLGLLQQVVYLLQRGVTH